METDRDGEEEDEDDEAEQREDSFPRRGIIATCSARSIMVGSKQSNAGVRIILRDIRENRERTSR